MRTSVEGAATIPSDHCLATGARFLYPGAGATDSPGCKEVDLARKSGSYGFEKRQKELEKKKKKKLKAEKKAQRAADKSGPGDEEVDDEDEEEGEAEAE
jgi:glutaredoxin